MTMLVRIGAGAFPALQLAGDTIALPWSAELSTTVRSLISSYKFNSRSELNVLNWSPLLLQALKKMVDKLQSELMAQTIGRMIDGNLQAGILGAFAVLGGHLEPLREGGRVVAMVDGRAFSGIVVSLGQPKAIVRLEDGEDVSIASVSCITPIESLAGALVDLAPTMASAVLTTVFDIGTKLVHNCSFQFLF
jgi:hypothetical protein